MHDMFIPSQHLSSSSSNIGVVQINQKKRKADHFSNFINTTNQSNLLNNSNNLINHPNNPINNSNIASNQQCHQQSNNHHHHNQKLSNSLVNNSANNNLNELLDLQQHNSGNSARDLIYNNISGVGDCQTNIGCNEQTGTPNTDNINDTNAILAQTFVRASTIKLLDTYQRCGQKVRNIPTLNYFLAYKLLS